MDLSKYMSIGSILEELTNEAHLMLLEGATYEWGIHSKMFKTQDSQFYHEFLCITLHNYFNG